MDGFIIGGEITKRGELPYQAVLGYKKRNRILYNCGGTLLNRYLLFDFEKKYIYLDEIQSIYSKKHRNKCFVVRPYLTILIFLRL